MQPLLKISALALLGSLALSGASPATTLAQTRDDPFQTHIDELNSLSTWIDEVRARLDVAEGQDRQVYVHQIVESWGDHHATIAELAREIERAGAEEAGGRIRGEIRAALARELGVLEESLVTIADSTGLMRSALSTTPVEERFAAEMALSDVYAILRSVLTWLVDDYELVESLGLSIPTNQAAIDARMQQAAGLVSADLQFAISRRDALRVRRDRPGVDPGQIGSELAVLDERIASSTANLQTLVALLDRRGFRTTDYERLLLTATGRVGIAILDPAVVGGLLAQWGAAVRNWASSNAGTFGVRFLLILLVLAITRVVARMARRVAARVIESDRVKVSGLLAQLVSGGASKAVWLIGFLVIMSVIGINVGPALAGLGIVGFVLGFALQDTLSNFAAGMMIMVYRPFDVEDVVTVGGVTGKVKDLTLVTTVVTTFDNQLIVIPNGRVWGDVINNATAKPTRRVDLQFRVGHDADVSRVKDVLEEIVTSNELVLGDPEPTIEVEEIGDWSVTLICRPWCKTEDIWKVRWGVTEAVKRRFDEEGITIPFPVSDVRISPQPGHEPAGQKAGGAV